MMVGGSKGAKKIKSSDKFYISSTGWRTKKKNNNTAAD